MSKFKTVLVAGLFLPICASAAWNNAATPTSVRLMGSTGDVTFSVLNAPPAAGCTSSDFYIIKSANNAKMALAILLMAKATGKTVNFYINDASPCDAATGRPMFTDITLGD